MFQGELPSSTKVKTYDLLLKVEMNNVNMFETDDLLDNKPVLLEEFGLPLPSLQKNTLTKVKDIKQDHKHPCELLYQGGGLSITAHWLHKSLFQRCL